MQNCSHATSCPAFAQRASRFKMKLIVRRRSEVACLKLSCRLWKQVKRSFHFLRELPRAMLFLLDPSASHLWTTSTNSDIGTNPYDDSYSSLSALHSQLSTPRVSILSHLPIFRSCFAVTHQQAIEQKPSDSVYHQNHHP